jgi:ribosome recycling factor
MEVERILKDLKSNIADTIGHVRTEFGTVHSGKASAAMVDSIQVEVYGAMSYISRIAAITTPDSRTISIQPWDRSTMKAIEKGILMANVGFTPIVDSDKIRCIIPEMTNERRQEMVKRVAAMAEDGRVSVRSKRRNAMEALKALQKKGILSEDDIKRREKEVQTQIDAAVTEINEALRKKEQELLTI